MVAQRHASAYLEIAEQLGAAYDTEADVAWSERSRSELDNWRAALDWGLAAGHNVALGQRLIGELVGGMRAALAPSEVRYWTDLALDLVDESTPAIVLARSLTRMWSSPIRLMKVKKSLRAVRRLLRCFVSSATTMGWLSPVLRRLARSCGSDEAQRQTVATRRLNTVPSAKLS